MSYWPQSNPSSANPMKKPELGFRLLRFPSLGSAPESVEGSALVLEPKGRVPRSVTLAKGFVVEKTFGLLDDCYVHTLRAEFGGRTRTDISATVRNRPLQCAVQGVGRQRR
jgi:hypothetical protein